MINIYMKTKICSNCKINLVLSEFTKDNSSGDGLRYYCKSCARKYHKQYRKDKAEILKQQNSDNYYKNKEYYNKKRKLSYKENKAKELLTNSIYKKKNKEKINEINRIRRAKESGVNEHFTKEDRQYTLDLFDNTCYNCGAIDNICVDHHYPLCKGNALTRKNAVVLCISCNSSKQDKLPEDFYTKEQLIILNEKLGI